MTTYEDKKMRGWVVTLEVSRKEEKKERKINYKKREETMEA